MFVGFICLFVFMGFMMWLCFLWYFHLILLLLGGCSVIELLLSKSNSVWTRGIMVSFQEWVSTGF